MIEITEKKYKEALNRLAKSDDGKIVLAVLKDICHWDMTYLDTESEIKNIHHATKRGVYGTIRRNIKPESLKIIEFDYKLKPTQGKAGTNERRNAN